MFDGFLDQVAARPNEEAYVYEGHHWTWKEVEQGASYAQRLDAVAA